MEESSFWNGSPKNMFYMGLSIGIGGSAVVALALIVWFMFSGRTLAQFPSGDSGTQQQQQQPDPNEAKKVTVKEVDANRDHILGNKNAKVTLVEYSDFQCPFCARHVPTMKQMLKDFPNDVRLVFRHFPLTSIHPFAQKAAEASECVAKFNGENMFWKFHDEMFASQTANGGITGEDQILAVVTKIGANANAVKTCLSEGQTTKRVQEDMASANDVGIGGTPANIINGLLVSGAYPYEGDGNVKGIKDRLKEAGASK